MFSSPIINWYTDLLTISRNESYQDGNVTKQQRIEKANNIPCRVYRNSNPQTVMTETAAKVTYSDMLACENSVDIQAGDELSVIRGGGLGYANPPTVYFAGSPTPYYEPFGGIIPDLAHQQVPLTNEKRN